MKYYILYIITRLRSREHWGCTAAAQGPCDCSLQFCCIKPCCASELHPFLHPCPASLPASFPASLPCILSLHLFLHHALHPFPASFPASLPLLSHFPSSVLPFPCPFLAALFPGNLGTGSSGLIPRRRLSSSSSGNQSAAAPGGAGALLVGVRFIFKGAAGEGSALPPGHVPL